MKLFVLALIILLIIVILEVTNFYKEGLDVYSENLLYLDSKTKNDNKHHGKYYAHFLNSNNIKKNSPTIEGGSIIGINDTVTPYSYNEDGSIIDPNAADLEAAKTEDATAEATERQLWYGTDATLKNNFEQATLVSPMFKVGVISTKQDELYDNVVKACSDNTFNMGVNPGKGKEYLYGWTASSTASFPCVGFYSHKGSRNMKDGNVVKKYSILVDCQKNDCNTIGLTDTPAGSTYPISTDATVGEVFRQKATNDSGRSLQTAVSNLSSFYEDVTTLANVEIGKQLLTTDEQTFDENRAMIECSTRSIDNNPCVGLAKVGDNYHYLYPSMSDYKSGSRDAVEVYRKLKSSSDSSKVEYVKVGNDDSIGLFGVRAITSQASRRLEGYTNVTDKEYDTLRGTNTFEEAKTICNNYGDRCVGFFKPTGRNKYYFLEKSPDQVEASGSISQILKNIDKYDTEKANYDTNANSDVTMLNTLTNSWTNVSNNLNNYKSEEKVADGVVMDGNLKGDITTFGSALDRCTNNDFPTTGNDSRRCVGMLLEKTANENESKYHFLRFKDSNDDDSVKTNRFVLDSSDKYTKFYPRKSLYDSGQYVGKISIINDINNEINNNGSSENENGAVKLISEFNENLTNADVSSIENKLSNYLTKSEGYLTDSNAYGKSIYDFMKELKNAADGIDSDDVEDLFGTKDYNDDDQRNAFIQKVEKHHLKMYLLNHYLKHLKFIREKRILLNNQKEALKNAYDKDKDKDITQIDLYETSEMVTVLGIRGFLPTKTSGYFETGLKGKIGEEITKVIGSKNKKFKDPIWVEKIHNEIVDLVKGPIVNMSIKCGGAFHWDNMGPEIKDYEDFKYEGLNGKCYKSYSYLDPNNTGAEWCQGTFNMGEDVPREKACLKSARTSYVSPYHLGYTNAPIIDEILYWSNYYFYNQNRAGVGGGNNLTQQYAERIADINNTAPTIKYGSEIVMLQDKTNSITLTYGDAVEDDGGDNITWSVSINNNTMATVTIQNPNILQIKTNSALGEATITLTATDSRGASTDKNIRLRIAPPPPTVTWPTVSVKNTTNVTNVSVSLPAGITEWEYSTDNGSKFDTGSEANFELGDKTYEPNSIHVRTKKGGIVSQSEKNVSKIIIDKTLPVITLIGDSTVNIERRDSYIEQGFSLDNQDDSKLPIVYKDSDDSVVARNTIGNTVGTYTATYGARDEAGNEAESVTRTIEVKDTKAPRIAIMTPVPTVTSKTTHKITVNTNEPGTFKTNLPNHVGTFSKKLEGGKSTEIQLNALPEDEYENYTISVEDEAGNLNSVVIPKFTIDTTAPHIELIDSKPLRIEWNTTPTYPESGVTSNDGEVNISENNYGTGILPGNSQGYDTDNPNMGAYEILYRAKDRAGNFAEITRNVHVHPVSQVATFPEITGSDGFTTKNTISMYGNESGDNETVTEISFDGGTIWQEVADDGFGGNLTVDLDDGTYEANSIHIRYKHESSGIVGDVQDYAKNSSKFIIDTKDPVFTLNKFKDTNNTTTTNVHGALKVGDTYYEASGNLNTQLATLESRKAYLYNKGERGDEVADETMTDRVNRYIIEYTVKSKAGKTKKFFRNVNVEDYTQDVTGDGQNTGAGDQTSDTTGANDATGGGGGGVKDPFSNYKLDKYTSNDIFSTIKNIFNRKYYD